VKLLPESIWLALDPVDMRTGVDGLSLHVQQALVRAPCDGTAYVFSNRRRAPEGGELGRYRRMDVPTPATPWPVRLAAAWRKVLAAESRTVAMAGHGRGLAAPVGPSAGAVAAVGTRRILFACKRRRSSQHYIAMNLLDELARTDIDPAMLAQVRALFEQQQAKLAEKDFKITALTHELAYLKRIRCGKASEVLTGEQRSLFEEEVDMDLAAIEGELENQASSKPARKRAGRQALPPELPRI
jgi:hypothetical protein